MPNTKIEEAILRHLAENGHLSFNSLWLRVQAEFDVDAKCAYRPVDRCLQRLRRAGKIKPDRKLGWSLVEVTK